MVQHLSHIQNLVTPETWYNIRRFRRAVSPLGASGSGFGIFQPPPEVQTKRESWPKASSFFYAHDAHIPVFFGCFAALRAFERREKKSLQ